ncbi:MAG: hypothetical protein WD042_07050 [Phycisphaeraceae bacterium]
MSHRAKSMAAIVIGAALLLAAPASAWHTAGHHILAEAAVKALPDEIPAFFRQGAATVAHGSVDPDVMKLRQTPQLRSAEEPEHYIDMELLQGRPLPATRYEFIKLCQELGVEPNKMGTLPYAVVEGTQRLTVAFAEHRRWPDNPHIKAKCLLYAGLLAHYSCDLAMPLHVTVHFDGQAPVEGKTFGRSPHTGIHAKVDHLVEQLALDPMAIAKDAKVVKFDDLMPAVLAEIEKSYALIEKVYELEPQLPGPEVNKGAIAQPVVAFANERARAAASFTASLYATAWAKSADLKLPEWHAREEEEK